jgi:hypothetical protein
MPAGYRLVNEVSRKFLSPVDTTVIDANGRHASKLSKALQRRDGLPEDLFEDGFVHLSRRQMFYAEGQVSEPSPRTRLETGLHIEGGS